MLNRRLLYRLNVTPSLSSTTAKLELTIYNWAAGNLMVPPAVRYPFDIWMPNYKWWQGNNSLLYVSTSRSLLVSAKCHVNYAKAGMLSTWPYHYDMIYLYNNRPYISQRLRERERWIESHADGISPMVKSMQSTHASVPFKHIRV